MDRGVPGRRGDLGDGNRRMMSGVVGN
jgi:hypothetical protein